jgi:hypothetical protein
MKTLLIASTVTWAGIKDWKTELPSTEIADQGAMPMA